MSGRSWYHFGPFRFDGRLLFRGGERRDLPDKEAQTLLILVQNAQHLVARNELLEKVYGPRADSNSVDQAINRLRKVLDDQGQPKKRVHAYIDTVHGDGYVFKVAPHVVHEVCAEALREYYEGLEWWNDREPESI